MSENGNKMLSDKNYIDRDAVLHKIEELLYHRSLNASEYKIVMEIGNYIAALPKESIPTDNTKKS